MRIVHCYSLLGRYLRIVRFILLLLCYFSAVNVPFSVISFLLRSQNIPLKQKSCHLQNDLLMTTLSVCRTNWVSVGPQQGAKQEVVKLTKDTLPIPLIDTQKYEMKNHLTPKSFHQIIPHALRSIILLKCPEMLIPQIKYSVWVTLSLLSLQLRDSPKCFIVCGPNDSEPQQREYIVKFQSHWSGFPCAQETAP